MNTLDEILSELIPVYGLDALDAQKPRMHGWLVAHPKRKLTKRFAVNWMNKATNQKTSTDRQRFVTREMVEEYCQKIRWTKLSQYAWGRLMSSMWYGVEITNQFDFESAMEVIQEEYSRRNR